MSEQKQIQKRIGELKREMTRMQEALARAQGIVAILLGEAKKAVPAGSESSNQKDGAEEKREEKKGELGHYRVEKYPIEEEVIEGTFDGIQMIDHDGAPYPVPENYASKSKLVVGDRLKLTITPQGRFVYKQIGPVPRETKRGILIHEEDNGEYAVLVDGKEFNVLKASVTYYKGEAGDEVIVVLPQDQEVVWAAIDNIVKELPFSDTEVKTPNAPALEQTQAGGPPARAGLEEI